MDEELKELFEKEYTNINGRYTGNLITNNNNGMYVKWTISQAFLWFCRGYTKGKDTEQ